MDLLTLSGPGHQRAISIHAVNRLVYQQTQFWRKIPAKHSMPLVSALSFPLFYIVVSQTSLFLGSWSHKNKLFLQNVNDLVAALIQRKRQALSVWWISEICRENRVVRTELLQRRQHCRSSVLTLWRWQKILELTVCLLQWLWLWIECIW